MVPSLYFITGSKYKFEEAAATIPELQQREIDLPELQEIDAEKIISAKLQEALRLHKGGFIVEDTSLYFDALNGLPGPLIKWFMKTIGNQGLYEIAHAFKNTSVVARTIIGYAHSAEDIHFFDGEVKGNIIPPSGESDFGWDPIFQPEGFTKSFAQISREEKNSISMRRMAFEKLKIFLKEKNDF